MKVNSAFSKFLLIVLVFSMVLSMASCSIFGGSLKLESFTVDRSSVKTVYVVGEPIDFNGIRATAVYSDETLSKVYTYDELTISFEAGITDTPGQKIVTVSFVDPHLGVTQRANVQITVNEDPNALKHVSYRIDATNVKTAYVVGETVDFTGIRVYEKFSDNSEVEITDLSGLTYTPSLDGLAASAGNTAVKVQYNGEDAGSVTVKVSDPEVEKNDLVSIVVGGEFKTSYEVGEALDLTGITVTLTYEDGQNVVLEAEDITAEQVDMTAAGVKTVVISFTDPINNEEDYTSVNITVIKRYDVELFEKPSGVVSFESNNKSAGTLEYGETGFQGEFLLGNRTYVVGDDNEWKFVPGFAYDKDGTLTHVAAFDSTVDLYAKVEGEYVLLEKSVTDATKPNVVTYTDANGAVIAVVDTYRGSYDFEDAAVGGEFKLSVLPSESKYKIEGVNVVTFEFKVIDAYNVYEAWQLAVIDNNTDRDDWNAFKNDKGLVGVDPAGIVIHNDIHISASDVPASFFNVSTEDVTYYKVINGVVEETSVAPAGTRYLVDGTHIYRRTSTSDFVIEGNFFAIDTRNFPLIASPAVFDANLELDYGSDYSNATLFMFEATSTNWTPVAVPNVTVDNIAFIGNASRDNWLDGETDGNLVTAGGLILLKSSRYANTTMTNTVNNSFFIAYFPDYSGMLSVNDSKCYDSYQNGAFVWADSVFNVENSYINGSGGPIIISQSVKENINGSEVYLSPVTTITGSKIETHVTGEEVWFKAVGATGIVGNIKALGAGLDQLISTVTGVMGNTVHANWTDDSGKMNIKAILMPEGSSTDALVDGMIQGTVTFEGEGVERWYEATENHNPDWYEILMNPYFQAGAPFITAVGADGTEHTIYFVQQGESGAFYDMNGLAIGTESPDTAAIIAAFASADQIVLHQGGLSAVFELYH